jgi:hypothetical protein
MAGEGFDWRRGLFGGGQAEVPAAPAATGNRAMGTLSSPAHGFAVALTFQNLMPALIGCFLGTIIGALPGLGPSNGWQSSSRKPPRSACRRRRR